MLALTLGKIDQLKAQLDSVAPFNDGEQKRLREQFMIEYTYNSNAIEGSTLTLYETALVLLEDLTIGRGERRLWNKLLFTLYTSNTTACHGSNVHSSPSIKFS